MAEIVEYRLEKFRDELNILVEFGLFDKQNVKDITAKRRCFEYALRKRTRSKLDILKYIKFEINFLESVDKYSKTVITNINKLSKVGDKDEELERKILLLQARKLKDVVRSRSAHISSLFRKLTTSFQFDENLWLSYIDFAKSRGWNSRVAALYWRLLRVASGNVETWIAAAEHEVESNNAYDVSRGLYLRALRHHPNSVAVWLSYFKMEMKSMGVLIRRAEVIFKTVAALKKDDGNKESPAEAIWDEDPNPKNDDTAADDVSEASARESDGEEDEMEAIPIVKAMEDENDIINGRLPKLVYDNAIKAVGDHAREYITGVLRFLVTLDVTKGLLSVRDHIRKDLRSRINDKDKASQQWKTLLEGLDAKSVEDLENRLRQDPDP